MAQSFNEGAVKAAPEKRLDDMLVDIDLNLFNLKVKVTRLAIALISEMDGSAADVNLDIAHGAGDNHRVIRCARIVIDQEDELIKIAEEGSGETVFWDDLDFGAQYRIVQHLYTSQRSWSIRRTLS